MTMCYKQGHTRAGLLILSKNGNSYTIELSDRSRGYSAYFTTTYRIKKKNNRCIRIKYKGFNEVI